MLTMAPKKGVFRLLARTSRVFVVTVRHAVMFMSQIWVTVDWEGVLSVGHSESREGAFYVAQPLELLAAVGLSHI